MYPFMAGSKAGQCMKCSANFTSKAEYWDHIYFSDCYSNATNKKVYLRCVTDKTPSEHEASNKSSSSLEKIEESDSELFTCNPCEVKCSSIIESCEHNRSADNCCRLLESSKRCTALNSKLELSPSSKVYTRKLPPSSFCEHCKVPLPTPEARTKHILGKQHSKVINRILKDHHVSARFCLDTSSASSSSSSPTKDGEEAQVSVSDVLKNIPSIRFLGSSILDDTRDNVCHSVWGRKYKKRRQRLASKMKNPSNSLASALKGEDQSSLDGVIVMLRRLCLAQLATMMFQFETGSSQNNHEPASYSSCKVPNKQKLCGISVSTLLDLFRVVCRDQLSSMFASYMPELKKPLKNIC